MAKTSVLELKNTFKCENIVDGNIRLPEVISGMWGVRWGINL